jgi:histone H3/H4
MGKPSSQKPSQQVVPKRHQARKKVRAKQDVDTVCSDSRAKRIMTCGGVKSSTSEAKRTFREFGHELLGVIAIGARYRALQRKRRTITPEDVVDSLRTRARMIIALPEKKAAKKKKKQQPAAESA